MTLVFEEEGALQLELPCEELASKVIDAALDYVGCPYEVEVSLLLTMNDEIQEMNLEHRQIDRPTDVLSFPMVDYETAGEFSFLENSPHYFHPESGELLLGDIVISKEKVLAQAEEYGHSFERELAYLITHGMLHLLGYDHMIEEEKAQMRKREEEILGLLEITRD